MGYCSWCGTEKICDKIIYCQSEENERHKLCSTCHLNGHACQSSCPLCWYYLTEKLLKKDKLCSGCIEPLTENEHKIDNKNHLLCKYCVECILCSFRKQTSKEFFLLTYRKHGTQIQKMLYLMQICVQKSETDYEVCSICMELLNENNEIKILDQCKHRFHSNCIQKWFQFKSCCPCCRQVYQNNNLPSNSNFKNKFISFSIF